MKLTQKILVAFLVVIAITIVASSVAIHSTRSVYDSFGIIIHESIPELHSLSEINSLVSRMHIEALSVVYLLAAGDSEEAEEEYKEYMESYDRIDGELKKLLAIKFAGEEEEEEFEEARLHQQVLVQARFLKKATQEFVKGAENGVSAAELIRLKSVLEDAEDQFDEVIFQAIDLEAEEIVERGESASKVSALSTGLILGMSALSLLLIALSGWVLSRSILQTVRQLNLGARRVSGGELDFKIDTRRKDELGDLAIRFNDMTQKLKSSLGQKSEQAAVMLDELVRVKEDLDAKISETERMNQLMIDRELKMRELKQEIALLKKEHPAHEGELSPAEDSNPEPESKPPKS